jgi:hypothetical protein
MLLTHPKCELSLIIEKKVSDFSENRWIWVMGHLHVHTARLPANFDLIESSFA